LIFIDLLRLLYFIKKIKQYFSSFMATFDYEDTLLPRVARRQRRRLVINIGGAKIWVTNIGGGKNLGKIYFQTTFSKKF